MKSRMFSKVAVKGRRSRSDPASHNIPAVRSIKPTADGPTYRPFLNAATRIQSVVELGREVFRRPMQGTQDLALELVPLRESPLNYPASFWRIYLQGSLTPLQVWPRSTLGKRSPHRFRSGQYTMLGGIWRGNSLTVL
jgi:hypothetical protein